jgi:Uma2 family endonuclease
MSTLTKSSPRTIVAPKFHNGDEFLHSIGDVPMSRVIFNPWPGTATEQDLLQFVEQDKRLCELIDGTLVEKPMGMYESLIASWLIYYLNLFIDAHPIGIITGEAGMMRLVSGRVRIPNVSFISSARLLGHELSKEPIPAIGPDLAVEVVSQGNTTAEMQQKTREYFQSGATLVWLIYPRDRTVAIFDAPTDQPMKVLNQSDILDGANVLPGFSLELNKLFAKLPK